MLSTSRPAADPVSSDSATLTTRRGGEALEQLGQVLDAAGEPVQLGDDDNIHRARVDQGQKPLHARAVERLGRFGVHDDLRQVRPLHHGHRADLFRLRRERNPVVRLLLRAHPNVADCLHELIIPNRGCLDKMVG